MEKINLQNVFLYGFTLWLIFVRSRSLSDRKIFLAGVVLFGVSTIFILVKYFPVAEIYFHLAFVCLVVGIVKAGLRYKDGH